MFSNSYLRKKARVNKAPAEVLMDFHHEVFGYGGLLLDL